MTSAAVRSESRSNALEAQYHMAGLGRAHVQTAQSHSPVSLPAGGPRLLGRGR
eukprot:CAMPEP_0206006776 /NCGR_PEP_ID=MMETSP1464-20131121/5375_1 /ASSEMBLY_ACC=CAM_ASM_001124 /TAXON_ID=119497 /ORGANISM="Exanthemachrysis gayraliae, Strain RCC1523" /LENGTH=52 /DNA_ID=CAMNT_0053380259 /DNA_START=35 /DNA_END=190 /DNA_ORIENTATION=-